MGLKDYRLWVMGQLDSTCRAPPRQRQQAVHRHLSAVILAPAPATATATAAATLATAAHLSVALQVAFERQVLKRGFHFIGYRLWV
jgi:hypothetical protein